jgi:AcrR family transcriptional regulator
MPRAEAKAKAARPVTRYAKGHVRQAEILAAAKRIFWERGYRGTTLRDVAAECGIAHSTLLHYFPAKEALLEAVLGERDAQVRAESQHLRTAEDLLAFTRRIGSTQGTDPTMIELTTKMMAEATDPAHPAHRFYRERSRQIVDNLAEVLRSARSHGLLRDGVDPHEAAQTFFALREGAQLQWLLEPGSIDVPEVLYKHQRAWFTDAALAASGA